MSDDWPDFIPIEGVTFKLVAVKQGFDREGRMRYSMRHEDGSHLRIIRSQHHKGKLGISFRSPLGVVAFDFAMEDGEE